LLALDTTDESLSVIATLTRYLSYPASLVSPN
jgi:hypothetical protein